jgi:hypothetical protein
MFTKLYRHFRHSFIKSLCASNCPILDWRAISQLSRLSRWFSSQKTSSGWSWSKKLAIFNRSPFESGRSTVETLLVNQQQFYDIHISPSASNRSVCIEFCICWWTICAKNKKNMQKQCYRVFHNWLASHYPIKPARICECHYIFHTYHRWCVISNLSPLFTSVVILSFYC